MRQLGRYVLEQVLGRGGAGSVHRALLSGPGGFSRPVALKVLHEESGELRREARIGGLLRHQHLVDVYEIGEADGRWFCAMELCPEGSLSGHIPLPPRAVVEVGLQVCEALQYAHEELGLIHLDLKPDNLLLKDGVVKVADLGIARARGFAADRRVRGTPGYMPPEQRAGAPLDARADIYALGVTLVVLATCALPDFTRSRSDRDIANASAPTVSTMYPDAGSDTWTGEEPAEPEEFEEPPESATPAVSGSETLDWDDLTPAAPQPAAASSSLEVAGVPAWLVPVVERCLAESPDGRWQDMAELAEALRALTPSGLGLRETIGWTPPPGPDRRRDTNLPKARDTFVGREAELAALAGPSRPPVW